MIKQHEYLLLDNCWRIDINAFSQLISDGQSYYKRQKVEVKEG